MNLNRHKHSALSVCFLLRTWLCCWNFPLRLRLSWVEDVILTGTRVWKLVLSGKICKLCVVHFESQRFCLVELNEQRNYVGRILFGYWVLWSREACILWLIFVCEMCALVSAILSWPICMRRSCVWLLSTERTQAYSETKYEGKDQCLCFVPEAQTSQRYLDPYGKSGCCLIMHPPFLVTPPLLDFQPKQNPSLIRVVRKATLSSPCLWASFHPLSPLSVVSTK
jgi:hypothetical protein